MTTPEPTVKTVRNARLKLTLMFLAPALAVLLATLVYFTGVGLPRGTTNKGVLVQPPRQLDEIALQEAAGVPWRYDAEARGWGILNTAGTTCDTPCRERLVLGRQVRIALGKDADRVRRYFLVAGGAPEPELAAYLAAEHKDLQVLVTDPRAMQALLGRPGDPDPLGGGALYLVDPHGFVMMHYLPTHPGRATLDDLRFLLKNNPG